MQRRPLRTDWGLAGVLALAPFAFAYGLVYWGEQYVPSGLAAVLFGILPLYTALLGSVLLHDEPLRAPLLLGVLIGIGGLVARVPRERGARVGREGRPGGAALALAPLGAAVGGIAQKLRRRRAGRGGAERLGDAGRAGCSCCRCRLLSEDWGDFVWSAGVGGLDRVSGAVRLGDRVRDADGAAPLTSARWPMAFLAMLLPFGALIFGAMLYDERDHARARGRGGAGGGRPRRSPSGRAARGRAVSGGARNGRA